MATTASHIPAGIRHGNRPRSWDLPDDADLCPTCEGDGELAYEAGNTGELMVGICHDCIGSGLDHTFDDEPADAGHDVFETAMRAKYPEVS